MAPEDSPRLTTGIFGTQMLLDELSKNGRSDLAFALADRKTFPSWNWMLENGATTLWEHWEGSDNTFSNNHPMFGSISAWFFNWLGGIQCADDAVAFDRILIRPQIVEGLDWVKSSHESARGTIVSNWTQSGGMYELEVTIPPTATAIVELPVKPGYFLLENGKFFSKTPEIQTLESSPRKNRVKVGSGTYRFHLRPIR